MSEFPSSVGLLVHPYRRVHPVTHGLTELRQLTRDGGAALVWVMGEHVRSTVPEVVRCRPGGVSLLAILPPRRSIEANPEVLHVVQAARAQGILPFHSSPSPADLAELLRQPPRDLAAEVVEYIRWRGLGVDRDTAQIIRRIIDLSQHLRSISAVSRSMYVSRRALGRRLASRGLPVPSHWLQVGRLLRVILRLQNSHETVSSIAFECGYPDGFSVSNQMERLLGHRPTEVRERLGWEWILEVWLKHEAEIGRLRPRPAPSKWTPRRTAAAKSAIGVDQPPKHHCAGRGSARRR